MSDQTKDGIISMMGNNKGNGDASTWDETGRPIANKAQHETTMQEPISSSDNSPMIVGMDIPPPRPTEARHPTITPLVKYHRDTEFEGSGTSHPPAVNDDGSNVCLPKNNSMEAEISHRPEVQIVHNRKSLPKQMQQQHHQAPSNSVADVPSEAKLAASIPAILSGSTTAKSQHGPSQQHQQQHHTLSSNSVAVVPPAEKVAAFIPSMLSGNSTTKSQHTPLLQEQQAQPAPPQPSTEFSASNCVGTHDSGELGSPRIHSEVQTQQQQQHRSPLNSFAAIPPVAKVADSIPTTKSQHMLSQHQQPTPLQPPTEFSVSNVVDSDSGALASPRKRLSGKDRRRKNRRRLHRLLKNPRVLPSFLKVIEQRKKIKTEPNTSDTTVSKGETIDVASGDDSDEDFLLEPPIVVIDVDAYLGLKKKRKLFPEPILSASRVGSNDAIFPATMSSNAQTPLPTRVSSSTTAASGVVPRGIVASDNSSDEGWYVGNRPMAIMPDDAMYLTETQQFVRKNMEFFSATEEHSGAASGRRGSTARGRVGFRCVHCAKAFRNRECTRMPPGSVSFPISFAAMYNLAIQKQQMHFEQCPHIPFNMKWSNIRDPEASPRKRLRSGIPALAYWYISCRRLGLVELRNKAGLRFGRDLKLEPLPFQRIRVEVEQEQPTLFGKHKHSTIIEISPPETALSANAVGMTGRTAATSAATTSATTPSAVDAVAFSKAVVDVLEEAKRREDGPTNQFISKEDATSLSDFMFLTVQQSTFCHAMKEDFATRGKKTKLMRLGFTGFCCRHCKLNYYPTNGTSHSDRAAVSGNKLVLPVFQNSCRSFSSSRDNLTSAMTNSFVLHLVKCEHTPHRIKHAMQFLKRVHSKQMLELPYGSQSKIFLKIWERIRAADKPIETGVDRGVTSISSQVLKQNEEDDEYLPDTIGSSLRKDERIRSPKRAFSSKAPSSLSVVGNEEFRKVLKDAEESWEPSRNDNLILPEDRKLISDFVFLCMRQLKVALPTVADFRMKRIKRLAGLCCIHCSGIKTKSRTVSSGRSFPSAPDNIASILSVSFQKEDFLWYFGSCRPLIYNSIITLPSLKSKSTLYNHLMTCPNVPIILKRTINIARKVHSQQCSRLPFGSQRRYFKNLFVRLRNVPLEGVLANLREESPEAGVVYFSTLQKCAFVETKNSDSTYWQCSKCRMVPYDYRAPGSIFFSKPSVNALEKHRMVCQNDDIYWGTIQSSFKDLNIKYGGFTPLVDRESFLNMIRSVVGSEVKVINTVFTKLGKKGQPPHPSSDRGIWRQLPLNVEFDRVEDCFSVLREDLCLPQTSLHDSQDVLKFLRLLSCNFQVPLLLKNSKDEKKESISNSAANILADQQRKAIVVVRSESRNRLDRNVSEESVRLDGLKNALHTNERIDKQVPSENSVASGYNDLLVVHRKLTADRREIARSKPNPLPAIAGTNDSSKEMILVNQRLTRDLSNSAMNNIESGQFDDA